jgi:DNA polymerase III epsilon subunit-like protein
LESGHKKLVEFAGPNAIMGVQNAAYDKNVLEDTLREAGIEWQARGWIDLKDMAGMTLPRYTDENPDGPHKTNKDGTKSPSNGLADITRYLGVPLGKEHHRADKDAEATAESMRKELVKRRSG